MSPITAFHVSYLVISHTTWRIHTDFIRLPAFCVLSAVHMLCITRHRSDTSSPCAHTASPPAQQQPAAPRYNKRTVSSPHCGLQGSVWRGPACLSAFTLTFPLHGLCPNPTRGPTPCQAPPHPSPEVLTTTPLPKVLCQSISVQTALSNLQERRMQGGAQGGPSGRGAQCGEGAGRHLSTAGETAACWKGAPRRKNFSSSSPRKSYFCLLFPTSLPIPPDTASRRQHREVGTWAGTLPS